MRCLFNRTLFTLATLTLLKRITFGLLLFVTIANASYAQNSVGVFYMPFWNGDDPNAYFDYAQNHRWKIIDAYDTYIQNKYGHWDVRYNDSFHSQLRIPLNIYPYPSPSQWYDEDLQLVTEIQLATMSQYGIDFVIYDSFFQYCSGNSCSNETYTIDGWNLFWDGVIENWLPSENNNNPINNYGVRMALMWANDFTNLVLDNKPLDGPIIKNANPRGCNGFFDEGQGLDIMIDKWVQYISLIQEGKYQTTGDGRPMFFVYYPSPSHTSSFRETGPGWHIDFTNSIEGLCGYCRDHAFFNGITESNYQHNNKTSHLLSYINTRIRNKVPGLNKDLYFVAVVTSGEGSDAGTNYIKKWDWMIKHPEIAGYDAVTAYGYKTFDQLDYYKAINYLGGNDWEYDYGAMIEVYKKYYTYMLSQDYPGGPTLDYLVPITEGWNRAPLNKVENIGSDTTDYKQYGTDNSDSTPLEFEIALQNAKNEFGNPRTKNTAVICCWNEHAEGTAIEPSLRWGYQYLEKIEQVFGSDL